MNNNEYWMQKAIEQAKLGHTPFGALIVNEKGEYIEAYNTTKLDGPTAHAELNVIKKLKQLHFTDAKNLILYTTVEPCPMCMSAIIWAGIGHVIYGASIADAAKFGKQIHISSEAIAEKSWYSVHLQSGVARAQCMALFEVF
ncbi:MAG: nucleoside deaminase [Psychroflexus sp.]